MRTRCCFKKTKQTDVLSFHRCPSSRPFTDVRAKFSNIFFLKILPLKDDDLVM